MFFRKFSTYDRADGVDDIITWQIVCRCDLCRKFLFVLYYSTSEMINVPKNRTLTLTYLLIVIFIVLE